MSQKSLGYPPLAPFRVELETLYQQLASEARLAMSDPRAVIPLHDLRRCAQALERIGADQYGRCLDCGECIELSFLKADPTTPYCMACTGKHLG